MKQYTDLITRILKEGHSSDDRTGVGTTKIFGHQSTYDMDDGFPLLTLKKTWMPGVTHELLWLLGCHMNDEKYSNLPMTNIKYMVDNKVHIWDEWADENGNLGPVYGQQWVNWERVGPEESSPWYDPNLTHINQIQTVVNKLTKGHDDFNPMDRGLIVSAWNVGDLDEMALRPCHAFFQFQARELSLDERKEIYRDNQAGNLMKDEVDNWSYKDDFFDREDIPKYELSLQLYQRSADTFLGVPFNIASYSLLLHMICHVAGMKPGKFVHTFGDAHLYNNHKDQVNTLLSRTNRYGLKPDTDVSNFKDVEDTVIDYCSLSGPNWRTGPYMGPKLPELWLNPDVNNIFDFTYDDIKVKEYNCLPAIKAKVAV